MNVLRAVLLGGLLLMADGIQQTAPGATMTLQNNLHADADLDGILDLYSFADMSLKALPSGDYVDHQTGQRSYRAKASIQNGDGTGVDATTIKDSNFNLFFDPGKTLSVHATGRANRLLEFGQKVVGVRDSGKDLWKIVSGTTLLLQGNLKLYGGCLQTLSGPLQLAPGTAGLIGELVNLIIQSATSIALGTTVAPLQEIYNVDLILGSGATFSVTNIVSDFCERMTIAIPPGGANNFFINTGSPIAARDLVMIGTPAVAAVRFTSATEAMLVEPTWPPTAVQVALAGSGLGEWWRFEPVIINDLTAEPIANALVEVYRRTGELLLSARSDSDGRLTHGSGTSRQCLKARRFTEAAVWDEAWPLTVVVNSDRAVAGMAPRSWLVIWPYRSYLGGTQKQLEPFQESLGLLPIVSPAADFRWTPGGGSPGLETQFTDESEAGTDAIDTRAWDFGDTGVSAEPSPAHIYAAAGSYDVSLTVSNANGSSTKTVPAAVVIVEGSAPPPGPTADVPCFGDRDVVTMLELEGQLVTYPGGSTKGILRRYTEQVLAGEGNTPVLGTAIVLTVKTGSIPGLAVGMALGTDGSSYVVREPRRIGDGAVTEILLAEA